MSLERVHARTQRGADQRQIADQPQQSPWLNTRDVAAYLRYTGKFPLRSVYRFMERHGIVARYDGRRVLIARADIERALDGRHGRDSAASSVAHPFNSIGRK